MKTLPLFLLCFHFLMMSNGLLAQVQTLTLQPGPGEGMDALIRDDSPYSHFGDDENITSNAWTVGGIPCILRSLVRFDLSTIPLDAQVLEARLSLWCNENSGIYQLQAGDNASQLLPVTEEWNEHTVTWVNQPETTITHSVILPTSTGTYQDYPDIDVTESVQDMVSGPATNYGWILRLVNEELYRSMVFASSDHPLEAWRPKLVVRYKACSLPVARFGYHHEGPSVSFSDSSSSASSWFWDFGDGYFSNLQNPVHGYSEAGKYYVCLTVQDSCGTGEFCDTVRACDAPATSFSFTTEGRKVTFLDQSLDSFSWFWNFGDGFYSDLRDPVHVFNKPGTWLVCLTTRNSCDQETYCDSITVISGTGTVENTAAGAFLFPNPAHGSVHIILPDGTPPDGLRYEIAEVTGKTRSTGILYRDGGAIALDDIQPGIYIFRIQADDRMGMRKLVVY